MLVQSLINGISQGSVYALTALGFAIIYGTIGIFHYSHGAVYTLSAYIALVLFTKIEVSLGVGIILTMIAGGLTGVAINGLIYEPMGRLGSSRQVILVASMGVSIVMLNSISLIWGNITQVLEIRGADWLYKSHEFGSIFLTSSQILIIGVTIVALLCVIIFSKSRIGLSVIALGNDSEVAENLGMNVKFIRYITLAIGSSLAALSSVLVSIDVKAIDPNMGSTALLMTIIAVIIGGGGNFSAAIVGGFLIGLIKNFAVWTVSSEWDVTIMFIVLILVIIFKPNGIFGRPISKLGR